MKGKKICTEYKFFYLCTKEWVIHLVGLGESNELVYNFLKFLDKLMLNIFSSNAVY